MRPQRRARRAPSPLVALLACALLAVPGGAAEPLVPEVSNPELYGKSLEAARQALEHYGALDDEVAMRRVADIGYRLAAQSGFDDFPFTFYLVDMPEPNAFALPGGQIFVTRGMLDLGLDDAMLASLLGHEIAHVVHRHGIRMQRRATLLNVLGQALVLGVLVGAEDDDRGLRHPHDRYDPTYRGDSRKGSMVQGAAATSMVISELLLRDYSREFEDEADESGQRFAAAAGFDPIGARDLWELMRARIPQSKSYGYWRTHPFSELRERAAEVRAEDLKTFAATSDDPYRQATQETLLAYRDEPHEGSEEEVEALRLFLDASALVAWPRGSRAEALRLAELHRVRDAELEKPAVARDYGALVTRYDETLATVRTLTPESPLLATLESERETLRREADAMLPQALAVWEEGVYQTEFLETFLSNYPDSPQVPQLALALGEAYARMGRAGDAVASFLRAAESAPTSDAGRRATAGLRSMTPRLRELTALQRLSDESDDPEIQSLAHARLAQLAGTYAEIDLGGAYLDAYPDGEFAETVRGRLEALANNLYGEIVLYQGIGDHVQALDRINRILEHAPLSAAADLLREGAVVDS